MTKKLATTESIEHFYTTISSLKSKSELQTFFELFFSKAERDNMIKRFETLHLLTEGVSYTTIQKNLGVSSASVSQVKKITKHPLIKHLLVVSKTSKWATSMAKLVAGLAPR